VEKSLEIEIPCFLDIVYCEWVLKKTSETIIISNDDNLADRLIVLKDQSIDSIKSVIFMGDSEKGSGDLSAGIQIAIRFSGGFVLLAYPHAWKSDVRDEMAESRVIQLSSATGFIIYSANGEVKFVTR
jgi:hypothetical protein